MTDIIGYLPKGTPLIFLSKDLKSYLLLDDHELPGTFSYPGMKANEFKQSWPFFLLARSELGRMMQPNLATDIGGDIHWGGCSKQPAQSITVVGG